MRAYSHHFDEKLTEKVTKFRPRGFKQLDFTEKLFVICYTRIAYNLLTYSRNILYAYEIEHAARKSLWTRKVSERLECLRRKRSEKNRTTYTYMIFFVQSA